MHFSRIGDYYVVSRITGPRHNLLQVRLALGMQRTPECERLPPVGSCRHEPLDEVELIAKVLEGVSEANRQFGAQYAVTHIRYIENDTKPEVVYGLLVLKIIEHLAAGGDFKSEQPSPSDANAL